MKSHLSFQAAAALGYHQDDITFLRDYMPVKNSKLQNVLADATNDQVAVYLLALALLYFRLTGPYWQLLGSRTRDLDFYKHVVHMKDQLDQWSRNASTIFSAVATTVCIANASVHPSGLPSKLPKQQSSRSSTSTSHFVGS